MKLQNNILNYTKISTTINYNYYFCIDKNNLKEKNHEKDNDDHPPAHGFVQRGHGPKAG